MSATDIHTRTAWQKPQHVQSNSKTRLQLAHSILELSLWFWRQLCSKVWSAKPILVTQSQLAFNIPRHANLFTLT